MPRMHHSKKYFGDFKNKKGESRSAYFAWNVERGAFVLYDAISNRPLIPGTWANLEALQKAGNDFKTNGTAKSVPELDATPA